MRTGKEPGSQNRFPTFIVLILLLLWPIWALDSDQLADQYLVDTWDTGKGLPANSVYSLCQTPDGYLWLATEKGLARFDGMKFSVIPFFQKGAGSPNLREKQDPPVTIIPYVLFLDRSDILWIGTEEGLTSYDYRTGRFETFTRAYGLQDEIIRRIGCDMSGNLWVSYLVNGVTRCSNRNFTFFAAAQGLTGKSINAIIEDQKGNLIFGARDKGVFIFKDGRFSPYPLKELENLQVIDMKEDRKGNLWIGTAQGLFKITGSTITRYTTGSGLSDDNVRAVLEDSERNLWVGTDKGLNRLKHTDNKNTPNIETILLSSEVVALFEDREKNLWVATNNEELKQIKDCKFISYKPPDSHKEGIILSFFEDRDKETWIGTMNGKLVHLRGGKLIETLALPESSRAGITAISEDSEGNLWLGTIDNGVFQRKNGVYNHYTTDDGLSNNTVTSIFKDSNGDLWLSTSYGAAVFRSRSRVFETFTSRNGLSGKAVNTIIEVPYEASLALGQRKIPGAPIRAPKDGPKDLLRVPATQGIWIGTDRGITVLRGGKTGKENSGYYLEGVFISCIYEDPEAPGVFWIATEGAGLKRITIENGKLISSISYTIAEGMATDTIYRFLEDGAGNFWMMSDAGILRVSKTGLNSAAAAKAGKVECVTFDESDGLADREFNNVLSRDSALKTSHGELWFNTKKGISIVNPGKVRVNKSPPPVIIETISVDRQAFPMEKGRKSYRFKSIEDLGIYFTAPAFLSPRKIRFKYRLEGVDKDWVYLAPGSERVANYRNLAPRTYTFKVTACNEDGVWNQTGDSIVITREPAFYQTGFVKILFFILLAIALAATAWYIYKRGWHPQPLKSMALNLAKNIGNKEKACFFCKLLEGISKKYASKGKPKGPGPVEEETAEDTGKRLPLPDDLVDKLTRKLNRLVGVEKIYKEENISLPSLADKLGTTPHILSRFLNQYVGKKFTDFINSYRVEEAKRIIEAPDGWGKKNSYIAEEAGFKNLTVFYHAFKKFTGKSPDQYKKEVEKAHQ
jgi:ligand-binding sensor domain-containing protein/AraC-like DNA-binding protein